jgi:hypothetical protein
MEYDIQNDIFNIYRNEINNLYPFEIILYDIESDLASTFFNTWINFYIDNPTEERREQCRYLINFINKAEIHLMIKKTVNNNINRLIKILELFEYEDIQNNKNELIFNDLYCMDFMVKRFGNYSKETIINTVIDMAVTYYFLDVRLVEWIIKNYNQFIFDEIEFILVEIIKSNDYANIDNSFFIIENLIKNINMEYKTKLNIFKHSIYYNNRFLFELFMFSIFDNILPYDIFKLVCLNVNPNLSINNTLVPNTYYYYYNSNHNSNHNHSDFYYKLKQRGQYKVIQWFEKYFDNNLIPLIDFFFIENNINIKKVYSYEECLICYQNKDKIISLSCHSTHNICEDCMKIWYKTNDTCPMCRTSINFSKCNELII